jgi:hypothetical protein
MIATLNWRVNWINFKPLCLTLLLSLIADLLSLLLLRQSINNYFILNLYLIVQFSLLIWLFRVQFTRQFFFDFVHIVFLLFALVNLIFWQGFWVLNSGTNVTACLILIIVCLLYFYKLLKELPTLNIQNLPMFWVSFGVLTYYAGNFFLFLVNNYLDHNNDGPHRHVWILHNLLNVVKNTLFAIALWQSYRRVRSPISSSLAP